MSNSIDLRTIIVDLDTCPTVGVERASPASLELEKTDYSTLLRKVAGINIVSFACSIICLALDLIFTLITLGIGASNRSSCPIEPRIPIYLIVLGSVNLVSLAFSITASLIHHQKKDKNMLGFFYVHCSAVIIILFQLFNFIWLIIGSVWVFRVFNDVQYAHANQITTYCQGNVYQFTVIAMIFQYVLPLVFCCCKNIPFYF